MAELGDDMDVDAGRDELSDEEVLGHDEDWEDYYNGDVIETEGDAIEEEAEARRLQTKQLQSMTRDDFEIDWDVQEGPFVEKLPTNVERPEFELLTDEFRQLHPLTTQFDHKTIQYQALSTYLGTIAMYFAIVTTKADFRTHEIIPRLVRTKKMWELVRSQPVEAEEEPQQQKEVVLRPVGLTQLQPVKKQKADPIKPESIKPMRKRHRTARREPVIDEEESYFGDEVVTEEQAAQKAKKRKSLRFYSSEIATKSNKRSIASRHAGGDDDLPYKEAHKRSANVRTGEDFEYPEPKIATVAGSLSPQGTSKPEEKLEEVLEKRGITYEIEKNKGLMPKRSKDVRNPRVKKRKQYDEKKKKLGSIRHVYKGEKRGLYGGETTGIKTNIVKSVKL